MLRLVGLVSLVLLAGCNGPKGSPGGSVKSFFSSIGSKDWHAMAEIISDDSLKRIGTRARAAATFERDFGDWTGVDITINEALEDADGKNATVSFDCISTQMVNYKETKFDCSDIYRLQKQDDGKWHINLGTTRMRPMQ